MQNPEILSQRQMTGLTYCFHNILEKDNFEIAESANHKADTDHVKVVISQCQIYIKSGNMVKEIGENGENG